MTPRTAPPNDTQKKTERVETTKKVEEAKTGKPERPQSSSNSSKVPGSESMQAASDVTSRAGNSLQTSVAGGSTVGSDFT